MARRQTTGTATEGYAALWEFAVRPARRAEFERHYRPDGSWATLFRLAPGYLGSELLHDRARPSRYVTIDRWQSAGHWLEFRRRFAKQYAALDRLCEALTTHEAPLGEYSSLPR